MKRIAILASGNGSNFEVIVKKIIAKKIKNVELIFLFTNNKDAFVIERAKKYNIKTYISLIKDFHSRKEYNNNLLKILLENQIEYVILAGYMLIIPSTIIQNFPNRIINIHPSFLPNFKGQDAIKRAYESDSKFSGISVHYVIEKIDEGEIILQKKVKINHKKNFEYFENKMHNMEYKIFYQAINIAINKIK